MTALPPEDTTPSDELSPRRMLDGGAGDPERNLVASARLDRVPRAAKARVAAALGGVLELQAAPSELEPAARGPLPQSGARSGLGVVGVGVVGAIALSLWLQATRGEPSSVASTSRPASLPSPAAESPKAAPRAEPDSRAEPAAAPPMQQPAEAMQQAKLAPKSGPSDADRSAPPRPKRASTPHREPVEAGLLAEVRALEAVSAAIGAAQLARAARELDAYHRRFPRGELAIEADVLAIQLAAARGDDEAASSGAERLLARPEAEHYRARVRALLSSPDRENTAHGRSNEPGAHMRARR
jgi:hypothetical protein